MMNDSGRQSLSPADRYDARVRDAVIDAYYQQVVARADTARSRAQSAYAIASAIAGALVGAALLSNLATVAIWIKVLGVVALACWLGASSLYIRAVSRTVPLPTGPQQNADELVRAVMSNVTAERRQIERWLNQANRISLLAMLLTATAFVTALLLGSQARERHGTIMLTSAGVQAVAGSCELQRPMIQGEIDLGTLDSSFVGITSDADACRGKRLELRIAKTQILTVATELSSR